MDSKRYKNPFKKDNAFPTNLRALMDGKVSQQDLGTKIGKSRAAVSLYCNGAEPDYETLVKIADYFGVSVDHLVRENYPRTHEIASVLEQTGLTKDAVDMLVDLNDRVVANPDNQIGWQMQAFVSDIITYKEAFASLSLSYFQWLSKADTRIRFESSDKSILDFMRYDEQNKRFVPKEQHVFRDSDGQIIGYSKEYYDFRQQFESSEYMETSARTELIKAFELFIDGKYNQLKSKQGGDNNQE